MSKDNSGPAYPSANNVRIGDSGAGGHSGMSLRDYFAASALQGVLSCMGNPTAVIATKNRADRGGIGMEEMLAMDAYRLADAMLTARVKP